MIAQQQTLNTQPSLHSLHAPSVAILMVLAEHGPLSFADLARHTACNKSSLSIALHRLRERGLVHKFDDGPWSLTPAGTGSLVNRLQGLIHALSRPRLEC